MRMRDGRWIGISLALALLPGVASAITLDISSPGVFGLFDAYGCESTAPSCTGSSGNEIFTLDPADVGADVGGTLTLGAAPSFNGQTIAASVSVTLPGSASLDGPANGVTTVGFSPLSLGGSTSVFVIDAGSQWNLVQSAVGTGSVSGTVFEDGSPTGFNDPTVALGGLNCLVDKVSLVGTCGFDFGASRDLTLGIGNPTNVPTDFVFRFNVAVVPEPATAGMMLLGLAGLALRRRAAA